MGDIRKLDGVIIDPGHARYCYSTQRIKTIRTSWFTGIKL